MFYFINFKEWLCQFSYKLWALDSIINAIFIIVTKVIIFILYFFFKYNMNHWFLFYHHYCFHNYCPYYIFSWILLIFIYFLLRRIIIISIFFTKKLILTAFIIIMIIVITDVRASIISVLIFMSYYSSIQNYVNCFLKKSSFIGSFFFLFKIISHNRWFIVQLYFCK